MDISDIASSEYFDREYYIKTYSIPDEIDPAEHYFDIGWKLCYDPSDKFSTSGYLFMNPDIVKADINPLCHYEKSGKIEKRKTATSLDVIEFAAVFDPYFYIDEHLNGNKKCSETDAARHYLEKGWKTNLPISNEYDMTEYMSELPEDLKQCVPLLHYIVFTKGVNGRKITEARRKDIQTIENSDYFDEKYYRETYGISRNLSAARHYYDVGAKRMYDPSERFSTSGYIYLNADSIGTNALLHFETVGKTENRSRLTASNPIVNPRTSVIKLSENTEHKISYLDDKLYDLVSKYSEAQQSDFLKKTNEPFFFNKLTEIRSNCVEWLPIGANDRVLIFGAGYGETVCGIAPQCKSLVCFDTDEVRISINEVKNKDFDNVKYYTAKNAEDFFCAFNSDSSNRFNFIVMTESFGRASDYFPNEENPQLRLLKEVKSLLTRDGKIVIACDNPYGFKYFNGSLQDKGSSYFSTISGQKQPDAPDLFTKWQIKELVQNSGFGGCKFYYPFPDYQISFSIFTDRYTPKNGELSDPEYTWEKKKLSMFDEKEACIAAAERGCFDQFSNSYIAVLSSDKPDDGLLYVKYSNDRSERLRIKTEIRETENGEMSVSKIPLSKFSMYHIKKLCGNYKRLQDNYGDSLFRFNTCSYSQNKANLEFIEGKSLYTRISEQIKRGDFDGAFGEFDKIRDLLVKGAVNFVPSRKFREVFGKVSFTENLEACPISNIDLILQNIIIGSDGIYNILDYEWTFDFPVPILYILFRSIFYMSNDDSDLISQKFVKEFNLRYGITSELNETFRKMEIKFQDYVLFGYTPVRYMRKNGHIVLFQKPVQVFEDYGEGFLHTYKTVNSMLGPDGKLMAKVYLSKNIRRLRIDPCSQKCIVKILDISDCHGEPLQYTTNGVAIGKECYIYNTSDPMILLSELYDIIASDELGDEDKYINIRFEILQFTENISKSIL